ncbi:hypothetical protein AMECASPLE_038463 [Ameca splendens]|uniref:FHA domain-containing protein n=1 Tax=Ameca splendens TaxID=208324 RepID=A0ABV0XL88_9TELE
MKGDKLIEKLIIDEKKFYLFGRNPDWCDFTIDHQSCSRVHSALVYHKHLKRVFLIDLNSSKTLPIIALSYSFSFGVVNVWLEFKLHRKSTIAPKMLVNMVRKKLYYCNYFVNLIHLKYFSGS